MKKVRVLLLSGCSKCDELIDLLNKRSIAYEPIDADRNGKLCDRVEALLNTINYPIIILEDGDQVIYLYRVDDSTSIGKNVLTDTVTKHGCLDVHQMVKDLTHYL